MPDDLTFEEAKSLDTGDLSFEQAKELEGKPQTTAGGAFGRAAAKGVLPTGAFAAGFGTVAPWATGLAAPTGPLAPFIGGAAGVIAGTGASILAGIAQKKTLEAVAPEAAHRLEVLEEADAQRHKLAQFGGELASGLPAFRVSPKAAIGGFRALPSLIRGTAGEAEKKAAQTLAGTVGAGATVGALSPLVQGRLPSWQDIAAGATFPLIYGEPYFRLPRALATLRQRTPSGEQTISADRGTVDQLKAEQEIAAREESLKFPPEATEAEVATESGNPVIDLQPAKAEPTSPEVKAAVETPVNPEIMPLGEKPKSEDQGQIAPSAETKPDTRKAAAARPKETLAAMVNRLGRDEVDRLIGQWDSEAKLSEDGKSIDTYADPRSKTGKMKGGIREFQDWLSSEAATQPAAESVTPSPAIKRVARGISGLSRLNAETERTGPDILDWVANNMRLLSKTQARKQWGQAKFDQNKSLWDDAPERLQAIHHNSIYGGKSAPDAVAQAAFEAGLLKEPTVNALWAKIDQASKKRMGGQAASAVEEKLLASDEKQHLEWLAATSKEAGKVEVTTENLVPGDLLDVAGERVEVTARDEKTGDITLKDGRPFGVQTLSEGQKLWVEKFEPISAESETQFTPPEKPLPKLRQMEKQGDLLSTQEEPLALVGEKGTDFERVERENREAAQRAAEAKAIQDKQQQGLPIGITPAGQQALKAISEKLSSLRSKLVNSWSTRGNKADIARLKDAADTQAKIFADQQGRSVLLEARRIFGMEARQALRAVVPVIESGGDRTRLAQFIAQSTSKHLEATKAARFADQRWDDLQPLAAMVKSIHDTQIAAENANGIATEYRDNYIKHAFDLEKLPSRGEEFFGKGGTGARSGFKAARTFDTIYDAIEAGYGKALKSIDADKLTQSRLSAGQQMINDRQWVNGFRSITDPTTGKPLIADVTFDRNHFPIAPPGYDAVTVIPGQFIAVHNGYGRIFDAVTGGSKIAEAEIAGLPAGQALLNTAAGIKHGLLLFDTFHASRIMQKQFFLTGSLGSFAEMAPGYVAKGAGFKKGLSLLEYSNADLNEAVRQGEITPEMANYARANRPTAQLLLKQGLNVGRIQEALRSEVVRNLPVIGSFNRLVFDKLTRGAMLESALLEFDRVQTNNPSMTPDAVAAKVAKDINVTFGNIGRQSLFFKSRTWQDISRLLALAPQWVESMARSELGGFKDLAKAPVAMQVGTLGKTMAGGLLAYVIGTQLLNLATRGHLTFDNKEEGHKLDAWIPDLTGKTPGFFLNPLSVVAELTHDAYRYAFRKDNAMDVAGQILANKASPFARSQYTLWSGKNYAGEKIDGTWNRIKASGTALVPAPIPVSGFRSERPGQAQRQITASLGVKTEPAPTAVKQISDKANAFAKGSGKPKEVDIVYHADSPYNAFRNALQSRNTERAQEALAVLRESHSDQQIFNAWQKSRTHPFTGSLAMEGKFRRSLSEDDRKLYDAARAEKQATYRNFLTVWRERPKR